MKRLIELAKNIKDEELRKKVVEFIKNPQLSHKEFKKYPRMNIEKATSMFTVGGPSGHISVERDILNHTIALVDLCLKSAETLEKNFGIPINRDHLIAAAILHDIPKIFEWKKTKSGLKHSGILLDHTMLGVAELYYRGFPESVIHIVASHFGESGPTPPRNFEALMFHHLDTMLSLVEFNLYSPKQSQQPVQLLLLDEDIIKKLSGERTEKDTK